jgi:hypothetical protein
MRLWTPRGVPPARLTNPTNASRGTGQYLQTRPDDNLHMVYSGHPGPVALRSKIGSVITGAAAPLGFLHLVQDAVSAERLEQA